MSREEAEQYFAEHGHEREMRTSVAAREQGLMMKQMGITAIGAAVGALAGGVGLPYITGMEASVQPILIGGVAGAAGGGLLADVLTKKEATALRIDREYLDSHMGGNNNWSAYRTQVMDHYPSHPAPVPAPHHQPMQYAQAYPSQYGGMTPPPTPMVQGHPMQQGFVRA